MPARRRVFGVFRCVSVWLAGLAVAAPLAWAQPLSLASDPAMMARVTLGELRHGQAAVGVWRDGKAAQALVPLYPRHVPSPHAHYLCWRTGTMDRWECAAFAEWLRNSLS